ncbi:MAG: hypothetical protein M0C28_17605 [Candidatus Moduliflexus flocculans]|nr:hypothetical protein [Candidatus Moduliflexus flocculans]
MTDPRNSDWVTSYRYNYLNQVVEQDQPSVEVVDEHGVSTTQTPTALYYYDAMGRQVGTRDANHHNNNRVYDAAGQLTAEIQADGAVVRYQYDALGRKTAVVDATGNKTEIFYDRNNRVIQSRNLLAQSEYYAYDETGNRIKVTNGAGDSTKYYYDTRGHVIRTRMPELQEHYAAYDLWGNKAREWHLGATGTIDAVRWQYDYFGRLTDHVDLGGADYDYVYNQTGQLTQQTNTRGQNLVYGYYENGQLKRITDVGTASGNLVANRSETWYEQRRRRSPGTGELRPVQPDRTQVRHLPGRPHCLRCPRAHDSVH